LAGAVAVLLPQFAAHPFFNASWAHWVGLVTRKPVTEDWVPVLPWIGVMWWGCAAAQWLLARRRRWHWLAGAVPPAAAPLAALGRWSLTFYMLHQPVFIGVLTALKALR
jgi:uncharacterized membrane protein